MKNIAILSLTVVALFFAGCSSEETDTRETRRGAIGKADHTGSCLGSGCDGKSVTDNCYCDDACEGYGDCCGDYEAICEANDGMCGGFAGFTCDAGEFCSYPLNATCGWADATGTCEPKPDACPEYFSPVCGCDGQTYDNPCFANAMGTSVVSQGACGPTPSQPLCMSNQDCALGMVCDTSECLSDCPPGMVCPAVCKGLCVDAPAPAAATCEGSCGGKGSDDSCWCDELCSQYGDCCGDFADHCE